MRVLTVLLSSNNNRRKIVIGDASNIIGLVIKFSCEIVLGTKDIIFSNVMIHLTPFQMILAL